MADIEMPVVDTGGDYFSQLSPSTSQQTCIDCSCEQVPLDANTCNHLHDMNDEKVLGASKVLADAEVCDYAKIFPKILYSLWCMIKNIIATICWLLTRVSVLEKKVANICKALACVMAYLKRRADREMAEALGKVGFSMKSQGEFDGPAYTVVKTYPDGRFEIRWNMVEGVQVGNGLVTGKVNHTYTANPDGSIKASIMGVTIQSMKYTATGTGSNPSARFVIYDRKGNVVIDKHYNPYNSFSDSLNKTITYNFTYDLASRGGTSGDVLLLKTFDDWVMNDTTSQISARYDNNNLPIDIFNCAIDIDCL